MWLKYKVKRNSLLIIFAIGILAIILFILHPNIVRIRELQHSSIQRIVFSTDFGKDHCIMTAEVVGNDSYKLNNLRALTEITHKDNVNWSPTFSPDGKSIVFNSSRDGVDRCNIYRMDADGQHQIRLTDGQASDSYPTFSPDGKKIIFSSNRHQTEDRYNGYNIYLMNPNGSDLRRFTNAPISDIAPTFSPDGQSIAFLSFDKQGYRLSIMNSDGNNRRILTSLQGSVVSLLFSPDGKKIFFVNSYSDPSTHQSQDILYVINIDGSGLQQISKANDACAAPSLGPYGKRLFYIIANNGNGGELFYSNLDGSAPSSQPLYTGLGSRCSCWPFSYTKNVP